MCCIMNYTRSMYATFLQYVLEILKHSFQNFLKTLKSALLSRVMNKTCNMGIVMTITRIQRIQCLNTSSSFIFVDELSCENLMAVFVYILTLHTNVCVCVCVDVRVCMVIYRNGVSFHGRVNYHCLFSITWTTHGQATPQEYVFKIRLQFSCIRLRIANESWSHTSDIYFILYESETKYLILNLLNI